MNEMILTMYCPFGMIKATPHKARLKANAIKLRKSKIVTGIRNDPVTIFMNKM